MAMLWLLLGACTEYGIDKTTEPAEEPRETSSPTTTTPPEPGAPRIEVEPLALDFGAPPIGDEELRSFTVRNVGDGPLALSELALEAPSSFVIVSDPSPATLAVGDDVVVDVLLTSDGFAAEGVVFVRSDDALDPEIPVTLTVGGLEPYLVLEPPLLDLGTLPVGCGSEGVVTARNIGEVPVEISSVFVSGSGFTLEPPALPIVLGAGAEWPFTVTFVAVDGPSTGSLIVDSNGGGPTADLLGAGGNEDQVDVFDVRVPPSAAVYLASDTLWAWDPVTKVTTTIGRLPETMYDIAIDFDGMLIGLALSGTLYQIDPATATSTRWLTTSSANNALTVLPDNRIIMAGSGNVFEVNRTTGAATLVYSYGGMSSGDITEAAGDLYWTVTGGDKVVHIDPATWSTVSAVNVGHSSLFGIAWPLGDLWAFANNGTAYRLDMSSGATLETANTGTTPYGATHNPRYGAAGEEVFRLSKEPIVPTITVEVDGVPSAAWSHDAVLNAVVFPAGVLSPGSTVTVAYETIGDC
jgi:hypothetical protein